jgi:hypothetical protein
MTTTTRDTPHGFNPLNVTFPPLSVHRFASRPCPENDASHDQSALLFPRKLDGILGSCLATVSLAHRKLKRVMLVPDYDERSTKVYVILVFWRVQLLRLVASQYTRPYETTRPDST